jgi:ribosomal protein S18 acetylase RimI-like enzyme
MMPPLGALRDGRMVMVRDLGPRDFAAVGDVDLGPSTRSSYLRYFGHFACSGDGEVRRVLAHTPARISLIGFVDRRPIALAEVDGLDAVAGAELAVALDDDCQGQGVGTMLLSELVRRAEARGAFRLRADVLHDNRVLLEVLQSTQDLRLSRTEVATARVD